jgi:hypothetical protein
MAFSFGPARPVNCGVAMATSAEQQVAKYEALLATSAGLDSVMVDGQSVRYVDLEAKCRRLKREVARQAGTRPQAASINLGGF